MSHEVVGYGVAEIMDDRTHRNNGLYLALQGQGIGVALTRELVVWHNEHAVGSERPHIVLDVVPFTPAVGFYQRRGFRRTRRYSVAPLRSGVDLPLMEMRLDPINQHFAGVTRYT